MPLALRQWCLTLRPSEKVTILWDKPRGIRIMPLALRIAIEHHGHRLLQPGQIVADQNSSKPEQKKTGQ